MEQQISSFEAKKKSLRKYLNKLDEECKSYFGPLNKYVPPVKNPYVYSDDKAYKKRAMGESDERQHIKKHCKFLGSISSAKDKNQRYYLHATTEHECSKLDGSWDPLALNRQNKFDHGVCWVTAKDKACAELSNTSFLRPYNSKFKDMSSQRIDASNRCNQEPGCAWKQQTSYTWDCIKGEKEEEKDKGPVMNPPKEMPSKDGLEDYIFRWYSGEDGPLTTELMGTGNRCQGIILEEDIAPPEKHKVQEYIDYRILDPHSIKDLPFLKTLMDPKMLSLYTRDWDELKKVGPEMFNDRHKGNSMIDNFYNRMDFQQLMGDETLEEVKKMPKKGLFPSVPQSVVNMIMKQVAHGESDKRGMLAWHSTGSGKTCTATGVIDSFWDTDRPIIFASSIDAIASNPDYKFHECAMNLYPRFQQGDFKGKTKAESMALIAAAFKKRNIRFLSFAKLSNRVVNAEEYKKSHKISKGGAAKKQRKSKVSIAKDTKAAAKDTKTAAKNTKAAAKDTKDVAKATEAAAKEKVTKKKGITKSKKASIKPPTPEEIVAKSKKHQVRVKKTISVVAKTIAPSKGKKEKSHAEVLSSENYVDLDNAVLIIDEVHNLFRPLANQKKEHERLEKEILDPRKHPNMKVVILTATPGDNIPDVLKLLNIIRNPKEPEIKLPDINNQADIESFKNQIRGMVSYFDMSNDDTKFPIVSDKQEFIKAPMSDTQFNKYVEAYKSIKADQKNYDTLAKNNKLAKYWEGARKYSNMLFNFDKDMALSDFSSKMPHLIQNIEKYPNEKQYVYSSFYTKMGYGGQGIVGIAKELEKKGYKKLTVQEAKKLNAANKLPPKGKRYILAITTEIGEEGGSAGKNLHELIKIYNHAENKNGELIHVMLASQGFNEGIDLKAVRHIHFFEPLVTMASDKQTLGRAARYCSHADLDRDKGEWRVTIHRYMSDKPSVNVNLEQEKRKAEEIARLQMDIQMLEAKSAENDTSSLKLELQNRIKDVKAIIKNKQKLKEDVKAEKAELEKMEKEVKGLATKKTGDKALKEDIKEKQKALKALIAPPSRKKSSVDPSSIENIEERIFKESRERMKELLTVYQCMKESAVDCKILSRFHSSTGHQVKCNW